MMKKTYQHPAVHVMVMDEDVMIGASGSGGDNNAFSKQQHFDDESGESPAKGPWED